MLDDMVVDRTEHAVFAWARSLRRADQFMPWLISIAGHVLLLILGFFVVWTATPPPLEERPPIVVSFDNPSPAPITITPAEPARVAGETSEPIRDLALPPMPAPSLSDLVTGGLPAAAPTAEARPSTMEAVLERRLPEVRFAGLGVSNATKIIYVVDASGSMVSTFPIVLNYLERSVSRLARTQRFQIIFYGREAYQPAPHPGDIDDGAHWRLIRATPDNVRSVLDWIRRIVPGGRSNPIPALRLALNMEQPDAVFLLSNVITGAGQWEAGKEAILKEIDTLNPIDERTGRRRTVIKTLQFLEEDPADILKAIGQAHGGEDGYKFIPRTDGREP
ncbi:MAG: hypothetical protein JNK58_05850 [Phycisphaerae bacterium]|nr:hypothetical protein [Phycisphaerae bacterium]